MSHALAPEISFHTATLEQVERMLTWAAREGWNPGLDDAQAFWGADPAGFFIATLAGDMVAAISVVNHDDDLAFLGLYLCEPEFRGQGIGFALWQHALKHAGFRTIGLDGVTAQEANYQKSGFVRDGAIVRLEGVLADKMPAGTRMVDLTHDAEQIAALDARAIGYRRPRFLSHWVTQHVASRKTIVSEGSDGITGFATVRNCVDGVKIGPIVAPSTQTAWALLTAAAAMFDRPKVSVDLPDTQRKLMAMLQAHGFEATFQTAHMFRGPTPATSHTYRAVASMECG